MNNEPLGIAVFVAGMFATAVIIWLTGLNRFNGTRFRARMLYSLWLIAFMSTALYFMGAIRIDAPSIVAAIIIGMLAAIPMSWWSMTWLRQRFDGHGLWYKPEDHKMRLGVLVVVVPLSFLGASIDSFSHSSAMSYVLVTLILSWLLSTLYLIVWVMALEHKLGHKVIEHTRPVSFE